MTCGFYIYVFYVLVWLVTRENVKSSVIGFWWEQKGHARTTAGNVCEWVDSFERVPWKIRVWFDLALGGMTKAIHYSSGIRWLEILLKYHHGYQQAPGKALPSTFHVHLQSPIVVDFIDMHESEKSVVVSILDSGLFFPPLYCLMNKKRRCDNVAHPSSLHKWIFQRKIINK